MQKILYNIKMISLIFGLILLATPFILMDLFLDKKKGFIFVLFFLLMFQAVLGLVTQSMGIFYYWVIIVLTILADIILLFEYFKIKLKNKKNFSFSFKNIDLVIIFVVILSALFLYQVHYNYTGKISLATDTYASYHDAKNMVYPYPYFSDEWYAVSLVKGAIINHSLPNMDILSNTFFLNLELFFHSFIAQIVLFLGLNPLLHYTILSIFFNSLIVLLVYLFLRINRVSKLASGVCSLFVLYITCGANLPGIWNLIPFSLGIVFFLISICFMELDSPKTAFLSVFISCLFYLPLILFYLLGLIIFLLCKYKIKISKERIPKLIICSFLSLFFIVPIEYGILMISPLFRSINYILLRIFFISLDGPFMPQLDPFNMILIPAIILAILGVYFAYKNKKWVLLAELIFGVLFWYFCSQTPFRIFIDYERVVIFVSLIVVIFSGFGLWQIEEYVRVNSKKSVHKIFKIAELVALLFFLFLVPSYTQRQNWEKITLIDGADNSTLFPMAPANNYLTEDDLMIFKNIKDKKFLSLPWKGTVIGVATGNYPVLTKPGTISIGYQDILNNFINSDCSGKEDIVKKFDLEYVYLYDFTCPNFQKIDGTKDGLSLYQAKQNLQ